MKSLHGLTRTLIHNMVVGVTEGYEKKLEVNGVGYRAQKNGKTLVLSLGYSHPVEMTDPEGIEVAVDGQNLIIVKGIDKEKVGQYAAEIRSKRVINPVTSISLSKSKITVYVGDTYNLQATITPPNASIKNLVWTSDDESVAKVYSDGDVVGVTPGRTVVHATSTDGNEVVANCTVIVKEIIKASSISVNSSEITMLKGKTRQLTARLYPTNTNEHVKWVSSDTSIVTVDANGNIITVGAGTCEVTAYSSSGTVQDTCIIHSMAMHYTDIRIEQYDTFNLYVDGAPSTVSWRTSNPRIATIDGNGLVTGRMPGECVISGTVDGKTVTCYVKVMAVDPGKFINRKK